ncbi:MAG: DNA mismatch repair protein MutS, partial [Ignavibacteria bacterium]|nr:DNA mismatch repair protein MutS [Ignavibacteria bacterium]
AFTDKLLDHKRNNYLFSFVIRDEIAGISFCDISTGEFQVYEVPANHLKQQIELISPVEVLLSKKLKEEFSPVISSINSSIRITKLDDWIFNFEYAKELLLMQFKTVNLKGFGIEKLNAGVIAAGGILNYLQETQKANLSHLNKVALYNPSDYMLLDHSTKRNLEIIFSMQDGGREGSLISILDKTETAMGGRLLKKWVSAPLKKLEPILARQNAVDEFVNKKEIRKKLLLELKEIGDLERLVSKICTGRANPRELVFLKTSLKKIPNLKELLSGAESKALSQIYQQVEPLEQLAEKIQTALVDSPPLSLVDGGVIQNNYSVELDELRDISLHGKDWIANL